MRTIEYKGHRFRVVDQLYNNWDFWGAFAGGSWENHLLDHIANMYPGSLLYDVGAWIGPISMWAASFGIRVVAFEPDPAALSVLQEHISVNNLDSLVTIVPIGITAVSGKFTLNTQDGGGDSQSSMARTNMPDSIEVDGKSLLDCFDIYGVPNLIKMDVEGGEGIIVPSAGPELRRLGIPLMLSLHWHWLPEGTREALEEELSHWQSKTVENDTVLYTP
jgi:FkbM family methyltransferase